MPGILRDWIAQVVEDELAAAVRSFREGYTPGKHMQKGHLACSPDALTIHLKKGKYIQIVDFNGKIVYPFHVTVSDATTLIPASFDQEGIDVFKRQFGRDFEVIRGGIVAIEDYYLTFNPTGAPLHQLMLRIGRFRLVGSEGSKTFGRPSDILKIQSIQEILTNLNSLISGTGNALNPLRAPSSPIRSQASNSSDGGSPLSIGGATPAAFATQIEMTFGKRGTATVVPSKAVPTSFDNLLGLLKKDPKSIADITKRTSEVASKKETSEPSIIAIKSPRKQSALALASDDRVLEMTSRLEAKANEQPSQSSKFSRSIRSGYSKSQPLFDNDQEHHMSTVVSFPGSEDSERESRQESLDGQRTPLCEPRQESSKAINEQPRQSAKLSFIDQFQTGNPFEGLKRVPRKYVRIPEAQQTILERNSWFKHQTDDRTLYASIPAKVRDEIAAFIDRKFAPNLIGDHSKVYDQDSDESSQSEQPEVSRDIRFKDRDMLAKANEDDNGEGVDMSDEDDKSGLSITGRPGHDMEFDTIESDRTRNAADLALDNFKLVSPQHSQFGQGWIDSFRGAEEDSDELSPNCDTRITLDDPEFLTGSSHNLAGPAHKIRPQPPQSQLFRYQRVLVNIPSSSPTEDSELELVVPHAMGDLVEGSDEELEEGTAKSQELSSTVVENCPMVQVEQSPYANVCALNEIDALPKLTSSLTSKTKRRFDEVSSDQIIPATFHDASSQCLVSSLETEETRLAHVSHVLVTPVPEHANNSRQNDYILRTQVPDSLDQGNEEEDALAEKQLFFEYESSQRKPNALFRLSPIRSLPQSVTNLSSPSSEGDLDPCRAQTSLCPTLSPGPESHMGALAAETPTRQSHSPQVVSSPLGVPANPARVSDQAWSSSANPPKSSYGLKRNYNALAESARNRPRKRRWQASAAAILKEENCAARDTKEMARVSRHSFNDRVSAAAERAQLLIMRPQSSSPVLRGRSTIPMSISEPAPVLGQQVRNVARTLPLNESSAVQSREELKAYPLDYHLSPLPEHPQLVRTQGSPATLKLNDSSTAPHSAVKTIDRVSSADGYGPELPTGNFWDQFKLIYPDYEGSQRNFTKALVYIEWLRKGQQLLHRSLCDDFIRVYATDYLDYIEKCKSLGRKPTTHGWEFYDRNILRRVYQHEFITPENLTAALLSLDPREVEEYRQNFNESRRRVAGELHQCSQSIVYAASPRSQCHQANLEDSENTLEDGQAMIERRVVSPIVGFAGATTHARTRQPFFETPSQLPATRRNQGCEVPISSPAIKSRRDPKIKSLRLLPWPNTSSPKALTVTSPEPRKSVSASRLVGMDLDVPRSSERSQHISSRSSLPEPPSSPILGREGGHAPKGFKLTSRPSPTTTSWDREDFKSSFVLTSKTTSLSISKTSNGGIDEVGKVEDWLHDVPQPGLPGSHERTKPQLRKLVSFQEFARSSGFSSRASTPSSTRVKRFCTKPAKVASFEREPKT